MIILLYVTVILLNILAIFTKKQYKLLIFVSLIFFIFIFSGNNKSGDTVNYIYTYNNCESYIQTVGFDKIMYYLMICAKNISLDFYQFKFVLSIIIYALYYRFFSKFQINYHCLIVLYLLHLFFFDVEQFRNSFALAVFLQGILPIIKNDKNKLIRFFAFTFIATTIHISFVVYFLIFLVFIPNKDKYLKYYPIILCFFCLLVFFNGNNIPFLDCFLDSTDDAKVLIYLENKTRFGFFIPFSLHFVSFSVIFYAKKICVSNNLKCMSVVKNIYWIYIVAFSFFPLYMRELSFYRYSRNLSFLLAIAVLLVLNEIKKCSKKKLYLIFILILSLVCWDCYDIFPKTSDIFIPVLTENYYLE